MYSIKSLGTPLTYLSIALSVGSASAALVFEEQFDYTPNTAIDTLNGGTGFSGPWASSPDSFGGRRWVAGTNFAPGKPGTFVDANGGLTYSGLSTTGSAASRFGTAGQRVIERPVDLSALTGNGTSMWFSMLTSAPNGNKFGSLIIGTERQITRPAPELRLAAAGEGFGVTYTKSGGGSGTGSPNAAAFLGSDASTIVDGSYLPAFTAGDTHHETSLIVGKINWNPSGTADEMFLFNLSSLGGAEPNESTAIATISGDFDQTTWDTLSLWDTGSSMFDEIRMGNTFGDVTPTSIPEPSTGVMLILGGLALTRRRRK